MNIVMASSDLYSKPGTVTIKSLLKNNKNEEDISIYYVCNELSDNSKSRLRALVKEYNRKITFLEMPKELNNVTGLVRTNVIAYTYCFLQDILPKNVEKVLLIEPDTIVVKNIRELYNTEIDSYYLAAVDDLQSRFCKEKIGISGSSPYFNCGVMLLNLKKLRDDNITSKISKIIESGKYKFLYEVQDEMNYCFEGSIKLLPPKYNSTTAYFLFSYRDMLKYRWPSTVYSQHEYEEASSNPVVVHFTKNQIIQSRPWVKNCTHPYKEEYESIMSNTSIKDMELWDSGRSIINKSVYFLYSKISKTVVATSLGVVHAYLYPKFLYRFILK